MAPKRSANVYYYVENSTNALVDLNYHNDYTEYNYTDFEIDNDFERYRKLALITGELQRTKSGAN